jgi:transmembrane sensor
MVEFDIILKYFAGAATPEEAMQVDDWADASNANQAFLQNTHQAWVEAGDAIYHSPDVAHEWHLLKSKIQPAPVAELKPSKYLWLTRVAALLGIVATVFAGYYIFNTKNQNIPILTAQATDKKMSLDLNDGSHIGLEPHASLVYPVAFANNVREVTLVGNGTFDVKHNAAQPFLIHTSGLHVKVLGTSFSIASSPKEVAVSVTQGLVAFYNNSDTLLVPEGNVGRFSEADKKFTLSQIAPQYGSFQFNNTPLSEVATQLSAHFKVDVQFINPAIKDCKMSGGFDHQTLKEILIFVSATFPNIEYKMEGAKIRLSGNACK